MTALWLAIVLVTSDSLPDAPEKKIVVKVCGTCHDADVVTSMGNTRKGWKIVVDEMLARGASATGREKKAIVHYLARNYPQKESGK